MSDPDGWTVIEGERVYFDPGVVMGPEFLESAMQWRMEQNVSRGTTLPDKERKD